MEFETGSDRRSATPTDHPAGRSPGHDLIAVDAWLPGTTPTNADIDLSTGPEYPSRYWRCRACGQERDHRDEFDQPCTGDRAERVAVDGGYSIEDPRTKRALSPDLTALFLTFGPGYAVEDARGTRYIVDIEAETCSCDDQKATGVYCEHLRRADIAIRTGELPGPDGRFVR